MGSLAHVAAPMQRGARCQLASWHSRPELHLHSMSPSVARRCWCRGVVSSASGLSSGGRRQEGVGAPPLARRGGVAGKVSALQRRGAHGSSRCWGGRRRARGRIHADAERARCRHADVALAAATMSMLRSPLRFLILPRPRLHGCLDLISSDAQGTWGVPTRPGICRRTAA